MPQFTMPLVNVELNVKELADSAVNFGCGAAQLNGSLNVAITVCPPLGAGGEKTMVCAMATLPVPRIAQAIPTIQDVLFIFGSRNEDRPPSEPVLRPF